MCQRLAVTLVVLAVCSVSSASQETVAVSPGTPTGSLIGDACPTFSWGEVEGTKSYELVVYRVGDRVTEEAEPVLRESLPGSASSWTPSLDRCLERGGQYAWSVRAVAPNRESEWSSPSLFEVTAGPSEVEFEKALWVVQQYLAVQGGPMVRGRGEAEGRPTPEAQSLASVGSETTRLVPEPPATVSLVTEGAVGVGTSAPLADLHIVGSPEVGGLLVAPDEPLDGANAELLLAEASDGFFGMKLKYDGGANELQILGHAEFDTATWLAIERDSGAAAFGGQISGDGSGLTDLTPGNLSAGTADIDITGTAGNVTGTVLIGNGGTGATTAGGARANLNVAEGPHIVNTTCLDAGVVCNFAASATEGGAALTGDSATAFFTTGQIEEPLIADEIARDAELVASEDRQTARLCEALSYRWVDLRDGTILDCTTGKQWLKDADCLGTGDFDQAPVVIANLNDGDEFGCTDYVAGTYGGWRVPDPDEYCSAWIGGTLSPCPPPAASSSLVDSSVPGAPKVSSGQGDSPWTQDDAFVDVQVARYWTSEPADETVGWWVDLNDGVVGLGLKLEIYRLWAVRTPP